MEKIESPLDSKRSREMKKNQEEGNLYSHEVDEQRWQAVCDRNQVWDGIFVFAVRTTGVYCRPSCTSRRANRENVSFYETPSQAELAGFRACQRCKPNQSEFSAHGEAIIKACRIIELSEEEPDLAMLAASAGLSPGHFQKIFSPGWSFPKTVCHRSSEKALPS